MSGVVCLVVVGLAMNGVTPAPRKNGPVPYLAPFQELVEKYHSEKIPRPECLSRLEDLLERCGRSSESVTPLVRAIDLMRQMIAEDEDEARPVARAPKTEKEVREQ